jgi:hypothetical protein
MTRVSVQNVFEAMRFQGFVDSKQNKVYYRTFLSSARRTKPKMVLHGYTRGNLF